MRLVAVALLSFVVVSSARCGGRDAPAPPVVTHDAAVLHPCETGRGPASCGTITVFEDRATRRGRTIDIAFLVARADTPGATEAVFVFAGGPGEGSTDLAGSAFGWLAPVRTSLDIVYVDQRGTGRSHPLQCSSNGEGNPAGVFGHVFDPAVVARCRTELEGYADLSKYTTDDAVADVDDVRAALGYERISLHGGSYGTRMAQAYMRRFPRRVRSAVIDGVVPFDNAIPITYAASAQQSLERVWAACNASITCRFLHPGIAADFDGLLQRLDAGPVPTTFSAAGTMVTVPFSRGDFGYAVRGLLYRADSVSRLPDMIGRAAASGDFSEFAEAYWSRDASLDQVIAFGTHLSVFCAEDVPFPTESEIDQLTGGTFLGRYLIDEYRNACRAWPRGSVAADARTPVTTPVPTLLVSGAFDPVTPPAFADRVAQSLPVSLSITDPAGSHGSSLGCALPAVLYVLERGTLGGAPPACR
jgi:pimeloyl-ACP methyl ester carboxylesterase